MNKKTVRLGNARLVWRNPAEADSVEGRIRQTACFKLPPSASGFGCITRGREVLHGHDEVLDRPRRSVLLAGGGRATFTRRFHGGQQVGAQLVLSDLEVSADDVFVEVLYDR